MSYGQFSGHSVGHLTIKDQLPSGSAVEHKRVGHNRLLWTDEVGVRYYRLIYTDIVAFDPRTAIFTIDYDGFHTKTTSKAMGEALGLLLPEGFDGAVWATGTRRRDDKRHTLRLWTTRPADRPGGYRYMDKELTRVQFEESITFRLTPFGHFELIAVDGKAQ